MRTVLGPVLFACLQLVLCCLLVNERVLSQADVNTWVAGDSDWDAHATVRALQVKYRQSARPMLAITGDSFVLENLDDPARLPARLQELGLDLELAYLATSAQTLWETVQVLDQLPASYTGAVVIAISPVSMSHGKSVLENRVRQPRMALDSTAFRDELNRLGLQPRRSTGCYFLDHGSFFAARLTKLAWWIEGGQPPNPHYVTDYFFPKWDTAEWLEKEPLLHRLINLKNLDHMQGVLQRCLVRLKQRENVRVALLDISLHPKTVAAFGEDGKEFKRRMQRLAADHDVAYWDLTEDADLEAQHYFDFGHLDDEQARARYQEALCQRLVGLLTNEGEP